MSRADEHYFDDLWAVFALRSFSVDLEKSLSEKNGTGNGMEIASDMRLLAENCFQYLRLARRASENRRSAINDSTQDMAHIREIILFGMNSDENRETKRTIKERLGSAKLDSTINQHACIYYVHLAFLHLQGIKKCLNKCNEAILNDSTKKSLAEFGSKFESLKVDMEEWKTVRDTLAHANERLLGKAIRKVNGKPREVDLMSPNIEFANEAFFMTRTAEDEHVAVNLTPENISRLMARFGEVVALIPLWSPEQGNSF